MAIKAVNNTAGPDGLVPILLVFSLYLRITDQDPLVPTITKRAKAIRIAIKEVRSLYAKRQVWEALIARNRPNTTRILNLLL